MEYVELGDEASAFARGGNRLCFVDPRDSSCCIKVLRPDRSPKLRRQEKGWLKRLRPLSQFDENLEEFAVWQVIERRIGLDAFTLISRCHGFVDTNFGRGLVMELIRDGDGKISKTLKQYLWENGLTPEIKAAVAKFANAWIQLGMPSKKLLLHNMLLKKNAAMNNIFVIDGLGWASSVPISKYVFALAKVRAQNKVTELWKSIDELLAKKQSGANFGYHGWLPEQNRIHYTND